MVQNNLLIDSIPFVDYEKLIYKNKKELKNFCSRLFQHIQVTWNRFLHVLRYREFVSHTSLTEHIINHVKILDKKNIDSAQIQTIKHLFEYTVSHVKKDSLRNHLIQKFENQIVLFEESTFSGSAERKSKNKKESKSVQNSIPNFSQKPNHSISSKLSESAKVNSSLMNEKKTSSISLHAPKIPDIFENITHFLDSPTEETALAPEQQGLVFQIAAESQRKLTEAHIKFLHEAETFFLAGNSSQDNNLIPQVLLACKKIKLVIVDSCPDLKKDFKDFKQWKERMSDLMYDFNLTQKVLFSLTPNINLQDTFFHWNVHFKTFLKRLDLESKKRVIKTALLEDNFYGESKQQIKEFIREQDAKIIIPWLDDLNLDKQKKAMDVLVKIYSRKL